jgi:dihydrofolate reductase
VLTRSSIGIPGAEVVHTSEEAAAAAERSGRCFVIGGASVYRQLFPLMTRVYVTKIDAKPESDSFFPDLDRDPEWTVAEEGPEMEENGIRYRFLTYEKISEPSEGTESRG